MKTKNDFSLRGFTIIELLVVVSIISLLIAILLPAIGRAKDGALITQSLGNLNNMSKANFAYAADWGDRHFTAIPDDAGTKQGNCGLYVQMACPSQQLLGFSTDGGLWGYWVSGPHCPQTVGGCYNWQVLMPVIWSPPGPGGPGNVTNPYTNSFGAHEMINTKSFNSYVNGRFYDKVYFAPKDRFGLEACDFGISNEGEFTANGQLITFPTYFWSPANMVPPGALASNLRDCPNAGKQDLIGPGGYRSPLMGTAVYPDQKTLVIEKIWLQNRQGPELNGNYQPNSPPRSWLFNEGYNSSPACLFLDGHTQLCGMNTAINDDLRTKAANAVNGNMCSVGKGLWHRGVFGMMATGWYQTGAGYDGLIDTKPTSFHMLTTDGILGRDILKSGI